MYAFCSEDVVTCEWDCKMWRIPRSSTARVEMPLCGGGFSNRFVPGGEEKAKNVPEVCRKVSRKCEISYLKFSTSCGVE